MTTWKVGGKMGSTVRSPLHFILEDRGMKADAFLTPSLSDLHNPFLMKDMGKGIDRMKKAKLNNEHVRIIGDYDGDGISSTYIMMVLLSDAGVNVSYAIPDRKDGYGISQKLIDAAYKDGVSLLITCDNGITAVEQVKYTKSLGMDIIITDHHEPQDVIPDTIVINPKQKDCPYPFKELAGCAVAWKFCQALLESEHPQGAVTAFKCLEIVATGTVTDIMPLIDENRIIVHYGLQAYQNTNIVGLKQLLKALNLHDKEITTKTIGFDIGPTLNATGRLITADEAVDMLLASSRIRAMRSANYMAELNKERKEWTKRYTEEILEVLKGDTRKVIVYARPDIPEGIVGIVAARIMNELHRPVLLMTMDEHGGFYKGSGRSIEEYNLFENLMNHKDLFIKLGGHAMACGFSIEPQHITLLDDVLNQECVLTDDDMRPKVNIDYEIHPHLISLRFAEELDKLKPFGKGNEKPVFQITDARVVEYKFIGSDSTHLKMKVACDKDTFDCIMFGAAEKFKDVTQGIDDIWLDLAFFPGINEWKGRRNVQLELVDFRLSE